MWWEDKLVRTLRCRLRQKPGVLGGLLTILGSENAYVGEIKTIHMGSNFVIRDITIFADDETHLENIVKAVRAFPQVELLEVRDEVLELHQGGKIAVRSRYEINNISVSGKSTPPV